MPVGMARQRETEDEEIPTGRVQRTAKVGSVLGTSGAKYAGTRARNLVRSKEDAAQALDRSHLEAAERMVDALGTMKGAAMKIGQLASFIDTEFLPPEYRELYQEKLGALRSEAPPMPWKTVKAVLEEEWDEPVEELFEDFSHEAAAAASIGQVHRAVMPDGRIVAVKVQYPGVDKAIKSDLDNAEMLYGLFAQFALKNLDVKALVDELRARMADELDYRLEAKLQADFAERYDGHPFIHVPHVVPERCARRVLTTEWADGRRWDDFLSRADQAAKDRAGEILFRFAQGSIHRHGVFNGDPHPGNYRFHDDGTITFLDFGLVKRWSPGEFERLDPVLDAVLDNDAERAVAAAVSAGFLPADHGFEPAFVFKYIRGPYEPYVEDSFTYTRAWTTRALQRVIDIQGRYGDLIKTLNMPTSYVILDRVVWGMSALLGRLHATNNWRGILQEYRKGTPPVTELGRIDAEWTAARQAT